jgi:hypothetical protein
MLAVRTVSTIQITYIKHNTIVVLWQLYHNFFTIGTAASYTLWMRHLPAVPHTTYFIYFAVPHDHGWLSSYVDVLLHMDLLEHQSHHHSRYLYIWHASIMCYSSSYIFYQVHDNTVRHIWDLSSSQEWHINDINFTLYYWLIFNNLFIDTFYWLYLTFTTHISIASSSDTFYWLQAAYVNLRNSIYFPLICFKPTEWFMFLIPAVKKFLPCYWDPT